MERTVVVECPHCGVSHAVALGDRHRQMTVELCDPMEGGCDRYFVARVDVTVEAMTMKIEGCN